MALQLLAQGMPPLPRLDAPDGLAEGQVIVLVGFLFFRGVGEWVGEGIGWAPRRSNYAALPDLT